jgi:hypothetical protein
MTVLQLKANQPEAYHFFETQVPPADVVALEAYADRRVLPRPFLYYVLVNDLAKAVTYGGVNVQHLPAYVSYLYRILPLDAWGSREKVDAWLNHRASSHLLDGRL